jgi:translocation and assembly module TamB
MDDVARRVPRRHSLPRRIWRIASRALLALVALLVLLVVGVFAGLRFEAPRAAVIQRVDAALADLFRGRLRLERLESITLRSLRASGRIEDPDGRTVVRFAHVHVGTSFPQLLWDLVAKQTLAVAIDEVHVEHAEVWLRDDGTGVPTLAQTFEPKQKGPPSSDPPPDVTLRRVEMRHVWLHGALGGSPAIDADISALVANVALRGEGLGVTLERAAVRARLEPYALNPLGVAQGKLSVPLDDRPLTLSAEYRGNVADTALEANAWLRGEELRAEVSVPTLAPGALARFSPELASLGPVSVTANAGGSTDDLGVQLVLEGKPLFLTARGRIRNGTTLRVIADFAAERVDLASLVVDGPSSRIDAAGSASLEIDGERLDGTFELTSEPGRVAGERVPGLLTHGTISQRQSRLSIDGHAAVSEPGALAAIAYRVELDGDRGALDAQVEAELDEPPRLVTLAGVRTRGALAARAQVSWPETRLSATASAELAGLRQAAVQLGPATVRATVEGTPDLPRLSAAVTTDSVTAFGRTLTAVRATFDGTAEESVVNVTAQRGPDRLALKSRLGFSKGSLAVPSATVTFTDREGSLLVSALDAHVAAEDLRIGKFILDGAGHASGSLGLKSGRLKLHASTERLDLARLARIAGISGPVREARASLALEAEGAGPDLRAAIRGEISHIAYARVDDGAISFDLTLDQRKVTGVMNTELVRGSRLVIGVDDLALPAASDPDAWAPLGRVRANGRIDLTCLSPLVGTVEALPIEDGEGTVKLDIAYARETAASLPAFTAQIRTHDLSLVGRRADQADIDTAGEAIKAAPAVYRGIDFGVDVTLDPAARQLSAHVGAYDKEGELLAVDGTAGPWPSGSLGALAAAALTVPIEARATLPERRLRTLPAAVRPVSLRGNASGEMTLSGTLTEPKIVLDARIRRLGAASERVEGQKRARVSVLAHAEYERARGRLELIGDRNSNRAIAANASWEGDVLLAASDPEARRRLEVELDATFDEFDLETVPALKNRQLEGLASGAVHAKYGPGARAVTVDLALHPLRVGSATMDNVHALVRLTEDRIDGRLDVKGRSGSLAASFDSTIAWPPASVPTPSGDVHAKVSARDFRLATLWPLVSDSVNELDGRLDAELAAKAAPGRVELTGHGRIDGGVVQIPAIGQRLEDISARIAVDRSTLLVQDLKARGVTGALTGHARVEVDQGLGLKRATASVNIEKSQKIPVTVEGVAFGDAWGRVDVEVRNRPERVEVVVRVPEFQLDVPEATSSEVQDLAPNERVRIGARRSDAKFVAMPIQPLEPTSERTTPLDVTVELGNAVRLRRGEQVSAEVTGKLHIVVLDRPSVTGEIRIREGALDVSGKRFEIERGTVKFSGGEPSNPEVFALARWDAPVGYAVYASYVGSAKSGKLTLRSEPPLTQDEILNLLLFGTPEGSVAGGSGGSGDSAAGAVGIAGGTAAQGFNRAVSDLTNLDIQARVDTSTGDARPELVVPLTRRLSARVTRAIGEPAPGASPDRTFLTLELRLKRHWALSALFGDRGASALDLVWRRHY